MLDKHKLLELVNSVNVLPFPLTALNTSMTLPSPNVGASWNTKVILTAVPGSGYSGNKEIFYYRIDLDVLENVVLFSEVPFVAENLIPLLAIQNAADLTNQDVLPPSVVLPTNVGDTVTFTITADPTSVGWIGEKQIGLIFGLPKNVTELDVFLHDVLSVPGYLP